MTFMGTLRASEASSRWLLLTSLALNLFFVGVGGAMLLRGDDPAAPVRQSWSTRSVSDRVERIAARLPSEDAARLRAAFQTRRAEFEDELVAYRRRQDTMRAALRAPSFDLDALKAAMRDMRNDRQTFDRSIHEFFAQQAAEMSPAGRQKLADWPNRKSEPAR
jgi:uncharacterized membrane protein